jgi:hypothetical protein
MHPTARTRSLSSVAIAAMASVTVTYTPVATAQLTDKTQTTPHVTGSAIAKSLEGQIGTGRGDITTPGSSIYLILGALFQIPAEGEE